MAYFTIVGEGIIDLAVASKLIASCGHSVYRQFNKGGHSKIDNDLQGFAEASQISPWLVLRDQDNHDCPVSLRDELFPYHQNYLQMNFRIVTREIESWLIADRQAMAKFLRVKSSLMSKYPDTLPNAKEELLRLISYSPNNQLKNGAIPRPNSGAVVGPEYNDIFTKFVNQQWNIERASKESPSLERCLKRLKDFNYS